MNKRYPAGSVHAGRRNSVRGPCIAGGPLRCSTEFLATSTRTVLLMQHLDSIFPHSGPLSRQSPIHETVPKPLSLSTSFSGALTELVTLMTDKEVEVRVGAVRALAHTGREEAVLLLRFKVLTGDLEPTVISECFTALMKLSPTSSLMLIADFIDPAHPTLCEAAALAVGESRVLEAFKLLTQKWEVNCHSQFRRTLLLPIALLRQEAALDFLLSVITTKDFETASAAIAALATLSAGQQNSRAAAHSFGCPSSGSAPEGIRERICNFGK
jgi:hypothetical protein